LARSVKDRISGPFQAAEIINADSMQVYRGLDIITNKATIDERSEVPHHLMDILEPGEEYRVDHFRRDAMRAVSG
jgi:tRNA dimethylallyltransferase